MGLRPIPRFFLAKKEAKNNWETVFPVKHIGF